MVLFAQSDSQVAGGGLLGLGVGATARAEEEGGVGVAAEVMAEDVEGADRVAEGRGDFLGGAIFEEVGAKGFVLALFGGSGFEEEAAEATYIFWCV
jgi:hypothetical protein